MFFAFPVSAATIEDVADTSVQEKSQKFEKDKPWRKKKSADKKKKKKTVSNSKKFKKMARDLLGRPHWSDRFLNLLDAETPKIAIHPFKEDDLAISLDEAQTYVDGFTKALIKEVDGRYAVVGRKELGAIVSDINEMGTRSDSTNPLGDLIDRARSDLLAIGSLSLKADKIILSYKLVETETGRIVSLSQNSFKRKDVNIEKMAGGLSLKGAAKKASYVLLRDIGSVRKIMIQGLRYQTSGIHTDFGRYFMGLLGDHLRQAANKGPRNINALEVTDFVIEEESFRGLQLQEGSVESAALYKQNQDYILKGTYWVFDEIVEVRLTLTGANATSVVWRGRIIKSEIPQSLKLIPPPAPVNKDNRKTIGPIDLYLSSNKGKNPLFKIGENMTLAVRTRNDSFLNCFYLQADGIIFKILPNKFMPSSKIQGGFMQKVPSAGMTFSFEMTPPSGVEAVKCFATDRDVSKDVEGQIGRRAFKALKIKNDRELTHVYRSLKDIALSEATLIVTVQ